jgi:two-component system, sensor histidine kinase PdtaS
MLTPSLDDLSMPVAIFDREGRYLDVNRRFCEVIETHRDKIVGASVRLLAPDFAPAIQRCLDTVLREQTVLRQQPMGGRLRHTPERLRTWLADFSPWPDASGEPTQVLMVAQEVTEQVSRERALSDSLAHVRRVLDSLFAFVGVLTPDGTLIEANRAPLQAAGIDWGDVHGKPFWDCKWWAYDPAAQALCRDSVVRAAAGETVRFDVPVMMAEGQLMDIDYMIAPMRDEDGHITHLIPSGNDITARVRTERGLLRSQRRFRELFETVPSGLSVVDEGGIVVEVNTAMEQLSGHTRDEMIGQPVEMLVPDQHLDGHTRKVQSYWDRSDSRPNIDRVLAIKRRDGTVVPVEAALTRVPSEHGRQVLVALTDCSQREAAKAQLEGALREKTGLLNEVHHRVKNNLQVVSSLLSLQLRTAPDEVRVALSAAQGRVKAMALIHQLLYEGKDYAHIDLGVYIGRLVRLLRESLLAANAGIVLQVRTPDVPVALDLQRAVPCGLLINELVTNALKHAFPAGRTGSVDIELAPVADSVHGNVRLTVRDDGIGLPAELRLDGRCTSLGLQLVPLLAEQLEAHLHVERQTGSAFQLDFAAQVAP